jgi:hypothetical protein
MSTETASRAHSSGSGKSAGGRVARASAVALFACMPVAHALDYQVHGFASQGFALSHGNNIVGESIGGNAQYFELGLNGTVLAAQGLHFSAQEVVRRSGELDDGDLRLDYAFADWQPIGGASIDAGVRAGRVKNPFGLFNETRDVVFTRPGILLPLGVYFETQGARSLLFASDGGQLYGGWSHGEQYTSLVVTRALPFDASEDDKKTFFAGSPLALNGELEFGDFLVARLMNDWSAGIFRLSASYLGANLAYRPSPGDPVPIYGDLDFDMYMLSARYNAERFSLTAEYQLTRSSGDFGGPMESTGDAAYAQLDYRFARNGSAMVRAEASFSDRNDRSRSGPPSGRCDRFGVWGEYYRYDGTSLVPTVENLGRTKDPHWDLALVMAAWRF